MWIWHAKPMILFDFKTCMKEYQFRFVGLRWFGWWIMHMYLSLVRLIGLQVWNNEFDHFMLWFSILNIILSLCHGLNGTFLGWTCPVLRHITRLWFCLRGICTTEPCVKNVEEIKSLTCFLLIIVIDTIVRFAMVHIGEKWRKVKGIRFTR